jgi:hypothetical protein
MPTEAQIAAVMMDQRCIDARDALYRTACTVAAEVMAPPPVVPVPPVEPTRVYVTDALIHPPPTSGPYAYATFKPGSPGFPGLGQTFVDPVFGSIVRRLTDERPRQSASEIYSRNGYFNADGSLVHHRTPTGHQIIRTDTGQLVRQTPSFNYDSSFDPLDADVWYYFTFNDTTLYRYSVTTGARFTVKTFAGGLGPLGGSVDWIDRTGRFMVLSIGGVTRVFDKQAGALYDGAIPGQYGQGGGWIGISPDAEYVITSTPPVSSHSWKIDHAAHKVSTTPVLFWTLGGGHADLVSASNSKTYWVGFDHHTTSDVFAVDVTLAQTAADVPKQIAENKKLLQVSWADEGHFSRISRGPLSDWVVASIESAESTTWRRYEQEILMLNIITGEVRRLAHHRSRVAGGYYAQPRVNASWDGRVICWTSNFGDPTTGYADLYGMAL